ncbi:MAG: LUD domain-containing protein [Candidatus Hadarchaeales archaeon]
MGLYEETRERLERGMKDGRTETLKVIASVVLSRLRADEGKLRRMKERYRKIKEGAVGRLEELVGLAKDSLRAVGCEVFEARKGEEAVEYLLKQIGEERMVVKSKSNTLKELELVEKLERRGVEVVETDLGDRIIQLAGEEPLHPVGPAVHLTLEEVARALSREVGRELPADVEEIIKASRERLRERILGARVGLTGANAIAAEEGAVGLVENEGNISLITRLPEKHLAVAGIEKIVPTMEEAVTVMKTCETFLTVVGAYHSFIKGPSRTADVMGIEQLGMHGAKEVHVVLLDGWRREAVRMGLEEVLYCCNCGACLSVCPVLLETAHAFSSKVGAGPIGVVRTWFVLGPEEAIRAGLFACTGCGACREICPGSIDFPKIIERLRGKTCARGLVLPPHTSIAENIRSTGNPFGEKE